MIEFDYLTQMSFFDIWAPLYHKKAVLLAAHKIAPHNKIKFTKAPSMGEGYYYISGKEAKKHPTNTSTGIKCYEIPLDKLETLVINMKDMRALV